MTDPVTFKCVMCGCEQSSEGKVLKNGKPAENPPAKAKKKIKAAKPVQQRREQEERDPDQWH